MPESLAFAEPLPAFVFQDAAFEASVKLVDEHKAVVTGVARALSVTLRFHDSFDIVTEQAEALELAAPAQIDPASGHARLSVRLKSLTAANDARPFCLEVRAADGAAESVFSTPVAVVKEQLRVVQEPPEVWFKDEGGREKCMTVALVLEAAPGAAIEDRVVPLDVRLLYESGNPVANQGILRLFPDMRPNMSRGRVSVSFRIDDVSKNHQGQAFVLEVAPEKQESSLMFQDIAPTRTSVIAIRSKRNKRKLAGTRASPRSVAGTPRANLVLLAPPQMLHAPPPPTTTSNPMAAAAAVAATAMAPPPAQRQRRMLIHGTPTNTQYAMLAHQPGSGRAADMALAAQQQQQAVSWSSHLHQHQHQLQHQHQHQHQLQQQHAPTPMSSPAAGAGSTVVSIEWKLAGFEINGDGSQNVSRPIYRCPHCKRLNDMEVMTSGMVEHNPQCVYPSLLYRSQLEGAAQQQQQQMQIQMQMAHQHFLATSDGVAAAAHDVTRQYQQGGDSPKTLAALISERQRPGLTISPFMNKVTGGDDDSSQGSDTASPAAAGNLFASNAFRNQMEISEVASHLDKQASFLEEKPENDSPQQVLGGAVDASNQLSIEDNTVTLSVGVGSALFNEMSSMGISLDQFDKAGGGTAGGGFNPLADFGGLGDEDQVFYILARMYTDAQNRKLGLPAFDQFQRMLGFYTETQNDVQTQVVFHALEDVGVPEKEQSDITTRFTLELQQGSDAVHSLPKYQHNLVMLREDALMYYWSQSLQSFGVN